jgi:hypothetical protein
MRTKVLWPTSALLTALVLAASAAAQPPGRGFPPGGPPGRGGPGGPLERLVDDMKLSADRHETAVEAIRAYQDNGRRVTGLALAELMLKMKETLSPEEYTKLREATDRQRRGPGGPALTADDVVERIMSFDKNKDGKITKNELPERMQDLIEKGDTNKDGALDRDEIKKLAADLARSGSFTGGGRGGRGGRGGPGPGLPPAAVERAVNDLKLSDKKKETAAAAVKAYQENVRKLTELARADLMLTMTDVLSEGQLKTFRATVERQPGFGPPPPGRFGRP